MGVGAADGGGRRRIWRSDPGGWWRWWWRRRRGHVRRWHTGPPAGAGGNAGDSNSNGGMSCDDSACVFGGAFASSFSASGSNGDGASAGNGGAGGGGGGFYEAGVNGGGGTGGDASQNGRPTSEEVAGVQGSLTWSPYDTDVVFGDGPRGDGGVIVQWATPAPAVTLTSSSNPLTVGSAVTFTATVSPLSSGGPAPTGTVQFVDLTTGFPVGLPQTLPGTSTDAASVTVDDLSIGTHGIVASYSVMNVSKKADSAPLAQDVLPLPPRDTHLHSQGWNGWPESRHPRKQPRFGLRGGIRRNASPSACRHIDRDHRPRPERSPYRLHPGHDRRRNSDEHQRNSESRNKFVGLGAGRRTRELPSWNGVAC